MSNSDSRTSHAHARRILGKSDALARSSKTRWIYISDRQSVFDPSDADLAAISEFVRSLKEVDHAKLIITFKRPSDFRSHSVTFGRLLSARAEGGTTSVLLIDGVRGCQLAALGTRLVEQGCVITLERCIFSVAGGESVLSALVK